MNAEQRVRLVIGEMTVQAAILQSAVEERDAKIAELEGTIRDRDAEIAMLKQSAEHHETVPSFGASDGGKYWFHLPADATEVPAA